MKRPCQGCVCLDLQPDGVGGGSWLCQRWEEELAAFSSEQEIPEPSELVEGCWEAPDLIARSGSGQS